MYIYSCRYTCTLTNLCVLSFVESVIAELTDSSMCVCVCVCVCVCACVCVCVCACECACFRLVFFYFLFTPFFSSCNIESHERCVHSDVYRQSSQTPVQYIYIYIYIFPFFPVVILNLANYVSTMMFICRALKHSCSIFFFFFFLF